MYLENIAAWELKNYLEDGSYQIIDLRNDRDYGRAHVRYAVHISPEEILTGHLEKISRKKLILYCGRGGESMKIGRILAGRGYVVKSVTGGFQEIQKFGNLLD